MSAQRLPEAVVKVIEGSFVSEFATVSAAGLPIDTPALCFAADDLSAIGVATGLAYPAKAERARRNPKVGLLMGGAQGEPVVLIRGVAAVRDADLQANALRYISEVGYEAVAAQAGVGWAEAREAVWYWSRIIIDIAPSRIMWWEDSSALDVAPHVLDINVPPDFRSDPAPARDVSAAIKWPQKTWQELADTAIGRRAPAHLTLLDADGWPLPFRMSSCVRVDGGFRLQAPSGAPWSSLEGEGTLTFEGVETFVGRTTQEGPAILFLVERALPQSPLVVDPSQVLNPPPDVREKLLARLREEAGRRGQPIPVLPGSPPARTRLAQARYDRVMSFQLSQAETEGAR